MQQSFDIARILVDKMKTQYIQINVTAENFEIVWYDDNREAKCFIFVYKMLIRTCIKNFLRKLITQYMTQFYAWFWVSVYLFVKKVKNIVLKNMRRKNPRNVEKFEAAQ